MMHRLFCWKVDLISCPVWPSKRARHVHVGVPLSSNISDEIWRCSCDVCWLGHLANLRFFILEVFFLLWSMASNMDLEFLFILTFSWRWSSSRGLHKFNSSSSSASFVIENSETKVYAFTWSLTWLNNSFQSKNAYLFLAVNLSSPRTSCSLFINGALVMLFLWCLQILFKQSSSSALFRIVNVEGIEIWCTWYLLWKHKILL